MNRGSGTGRGGYGWGARLLRVDEMPDLHAPGPRVFGHGTVPRRVDEAHDRVAERVCGVQLAQNQIPGLDGGLEVERHHGHQQPGHRAAVTATEAPGHLEQQSTGPPPWSAVRTGKMAGCRAPA